MSQAWQFRARTHRSQNPARLFIGVEIIGDLSSNHRACIGKLFDAILNAVLCEVGKIGAKRISLNGFCATLEILSVNSGNNVRSGDIQDLVAALMALKLIQGWVGLLNHRSHRTVSDDNASLNSLN